MAALRAGDWLVRAVAAVLAASYLILVASVWVSVAGPARVAAPALACMTAPAAAGEYRGFQRLADLAVYWSLRATTAQAVAAGIWADVLDWCGEAGKLGAAQESRTLRHHDDMTLLVLRALPAQERHDQRS